MFWSLFKVALCMTVIIWYDFFQSEQTREHFIFAIGGQITVLLMTFLFVIDYWLCSLAKQYKDGKLFSSHPKDI